jgi:hypothetical protein
MNADAPRTLIEQTLAELNAKHEINCRKSAILKVDPTYRRVDPDRDYETYTCAPETGVAIRAMIVEVCKSFGV